MLRERLYAHGVTPVFTKLNLLGLLHTVHEGGAGVIERVRPYAGAYEVVVLTSHDGSDVARAVAQAVLDALGECVERLEREVPPRRRASAGTRRRASAKKPEEVSLRLESARPEYDVEIRLMGEKLAGWLMSVKGSSRERLASCIQESFREARRHDRRESGGASPTLFLAPELGKYATSSIPYGESRLRVYEDCSSMKGVSMCSVLAAVGLAKVAFKTEVVTERARRYVFGVVAPAQELDATQGRLLYWLGRRLSSLSPGSVRVRERETFSVSEAGILALMAPVVKDATSSAELLSAYELTLYSLEVERGKQAVRSVATLTMDAFARLPDDMAGALLANYGGLIALAKEAPEFFNALGEYMLLGDRGLYVEALRTLASVASSDRYSEGARGVARGILRALD